MVKKHLIFKLLFCLFLICIAVLMIVPVLFLIFQSTGGQYVGYFDFFIRKPKYLDALTHTMFIAVLSTLGAMLIAIPAGYVFAKVPFRGRGVLFFIWIVVMIMPFQVTLLPHYALSNLLEMYDTSAALILPSAFAPIPVFLMAQTVKYVPDEIIEAARLETGSTTRILVHIITPSVLPGAVCTAVLFFADTWNQVAEPRILMETEDKLPLAPILHALSKAEPVAYAAAVVFLLGPLLLQLLFSEQLTEGLGYVQINKR